ncbi:MAG: hypothetical protein ACR2O3_02235 [Rhizobiaceae bacterium]
MCFRNNVFTLIVVSFALAVSANNPVFAFDAGTFLRELEDSAKKEGNSFTYKSFEDSSDGSFTVNAVRIDDRKNDLTIDIENLKFDNPEELGDKGLRFDGLEATNYLQRGGGEKDEDLEITAARLVATDFNLYNLDDQESPLWPADMGSLQLQDVKITSKDEEGSVVLESPGLTLQNLEAKKGTNFVLQSFDMEPATGAINRSGNVLDMGFDGLRMANVEHFGTLGFEMGSFEIGTLRITGKDEKGQDIDFNFGGLAAENLYIADPTANDRPLMSKKPLTAEVKKLNVSLNGKDFMGWAGGTGSYIYDETTKTGTGIGNFSDLFVDFSAAPMKPEDQKNLEQLKAMGYERLSMNIEGKGSWNLESGALDIDKYRFEFVDAGSIELAMHLSGYTEEVARSVSRLANDVNLETDPEKKNLKSMQMLAALTSLAINSIKISVEDNSLLDKVISLQATHLNQEPQQIKQIVGPMAQVMLAPYNVPEFAAAITLALDKFMQGNKTISVSAMPTNGLVITEIIALSSGVQAGQVKPAEIIERLNLEVVTE